MLSFRPGVGVRGQPALCPDDSAAISGAGGRRFAFEAGRSFEGENSSDEVESHRKDSESWNGVFKAPEDCWACGGGCRDASKQGGASGADCPH
jgi:hypothetical protein